MTNEYDAIELASTKAAAIFRLFGWTYVGARADGATELDLRNHMEEKLDDMRKWAECSALSSARIRLERSEDEELKSVTYRFLLELAEWDEPKEPTNEP